MGIHRWAWLVLGPGREYAGAWVGWRVGPEGYGYVGWGPLAPTWGWRNGAAYGYGFNARTPYTFCATGDLFSRSLRDRVLAGPQVNTVGAGTHEWAREGVLHNVGPAPTHFGIVPPQVEHHTPGMLRAEGFARPSTATMYGAHAPAYTPGTVHAWDRPVAVAPRYVGVAPRQMPYAPTRSPLPVRTSSPTPAPTTAAARQHHACTAVAVTAAAMAATAEVTHPPRTPTRTREAVVEVVADSTAVAAGSTVVVAAVTVVVIGNNTRRAWRCEG